MTLHLRATGCYLSYGITRIYTSELNTPHLNQSQRPVLDIPTPEAGGIEGRFGI